MFSIKMFGNGIRYWVCKIPMDEFKIFEKIKNDCNLDYESIFFDLNVLEKLDYQNWENIHCIHKGRGFFIKERNTIEIKRQGKLVKKMDSSELLFSPLLLEQYKLIFDDYKVERSPKYRLIALIQYETGTFFHFQIKENQLDINKLHFVLNYDEIQKDLKEQFISNLSYNCSLIPSKSEDVLNTGCRVVFL